jgi:hypothetical protein
MSVQSGPAKGPALMPSNGALELVDQMMQEDEMKKTILSETISAGESGQILESGRTLCPGRGSVKGPLARFPTSVQLQRCPVGVGGAWHAHVTRDELLNPRNSIPDIGTVVFGHLDAIGVVGTDSEEYFVGTENREIMQREFRNALGIDAHSFDELMDALNDRRIKPRSAQQKLRDTFSEFFVTGTTGYQNLRDRAMDLEHTVGLNQTDYSDVELHLFYNVVPQSSCREFRSRVQQVNEGVDGVVPNEINVWEVAAGSALGTVVSNMVDRVFFQR